MGSGKVQKEKINPVSLFLLVNFRGGRGCGGLTKVLQFCSAEASIVQVTKRHACQYVNVGSGHSAICRLVIYHILIDSSFR